jgi:hypothetical protein
LPLAKPSDFQLLRKTRPKHGEARINDEYVAGFICSSGFAAKQPHGLTFFPVTDIEQAYKVGL